MASRPLSEAVEAFVGSLPRDSLGVSVLPIVEAVRVLAGVLDEQPDEKLFREFRFWFQDLREATSDGGVEFDVIAELRASLGDLEDSRP